MKSATRTGAGTAEDPFKITETDDGVPTVHQAWSMVMRQCLGLGKHGEFRSEGAGNFNFRGIDDVMNLVGPILRENEVAIIPNVTYASYRDVTTRGGRTSREVTVQVQYTIVGPAGDTIVGSAPGESLDGGDKGTAKAMSVAFRVFLLQSLCLPTNEADPDSEVYQRSGVKTPQERAQETANLVPGAISVAQLAGVREWGDKRDLLEINVDDAKGNSRPLGAIIEEKLEELALAEGGPDKDARVAGALNGGKPSGVDGEPASDEVGDR